jgi:exodeoxyribonuclease III
MAPLKVVSFNIQEGGGDRLQLIAGLVAAERADFVALLEADRRDNAQAVARQLQMTLTYGEANCPSAVAWLSRRAPLHTRNHRVPVLAKTLLEIEVLWEGRRLHLFATHLGSRWNVQRPEDEVVTRLYLRAAWHGRPPEVCGDHRHTRCTERL